MSGSVTIFTNDPSKFHLLATQVKLDMIEAGISTVNVMAAVGRKGAVKNVQKKFTNRNTFTVRQIQFTPMPKSKYIKIGAIHSTLGATDEAPWMERQEEGGVHKPSRGKTLAIPTARARGGSNRRPVAASMRVPRLTKRKRVRSAKAGTITGESSRRKKPYRGKGKKVPKHKRITNYASRSSWMVARAWVAFANNLFLPMGGKGDQRNLFAVTKFFKTRDHVAFKLEQVYKFDQSSTVTNAEPWMLPASEEVAAQCQAIFNAQMKKLNK
jgi:hypothetical protein